MKKILIVFKTILMLIIMFFVTSCTFLKSNDEITDEKVQSFISFLDKNDKNKIYNTFAKSKICDIDDFAKTIDLLLEYYEGTYQSKELNTKGEESDKNGDYKAKWLVLSYHVLTSTNEYRIFFYWCTEYSIDENSIGIWSFYIIKEEDYPTKEKSYGGDGLRTFGINIGKLKNEDK